MDASPAGTGLPEELRTGHPQVDAHNAGALRLLGMLAEAGSADTIDREAVAEILSELIDRTERHYQVEEELMRSHGCGGLAAHVAEHGEFFEILSEMLSDFESGRHGFGRDRAGFLRGWVERHARSRDVPLARQLGGLAARSRAP